MLDLFICFSTKAGHLEIVTDLNYVGVHQDLKNLSSFLEREAETFGNILSNAGIS